MIKPVRDLKDNDRAFRAVAILAWFNAYPRELVEKKFGSEKLSEAFAIMEKYYSDEYYALSNKSEWTGGWLKAVATVAADTGTMWSSFVVPLSVGVIMGLGIASVGAPVIGAAVFLGVSFGVPQAARFMKGVLLNWHTQLKAERQFLSKSAKQMGREGRYYAWRAFEQSEAPYHLVDGKSADVAMPAQRFGSEGRLAALTFSGQLFNDKYAVLKNVRLTALSIDRIYE